MPLESILPYFAYHNTNSFKKIEIRRHFGGRFFGVFTKILVFHKKSPLPLDKFLQTQLSQNAPSETCDKKNNNHNLKKEVYNFRKKGRLLAPKEDYSAFTDFA